jgi:hypothetical protein
MSCLDRVKLLEFLSRGCTFPVSLQKMADDVGAKDFKIARVKDLTGGAARESHVSVT